MSDRVIDIYTHFMPPGYLEKYLALQSEPGLAKRIAAIPMLHDLEARRRLVGGWEGYQQVLSPPPPGPEKLGRPEDRAPLARFINEGLAALVRSHPEAFPAFVAAVPLDDIEAAVAELSYAVDALGARGVQIYTNVNGQALDAPRFEPLFAELSRRGLPAFLHPTRPAKFADYASEDRSMYEIWQVMGWPYETGACIARLVFSGVMDRHPDLKIVTHHCGGIIPALEGRIGPLWDQLGTRTEGEEGERYAAILKSLKHRPVDYFKRLYADTATGGATGSLRCGLEFFGPRQVMFASDCPFDPEGGPGFIREGLRAMGELDIPAEVRTAINSANACRLLNIA